MNSPSFLDPNNRPVQYFTQEYFDQCQKMSLEEIVDKISEQQDFFWRIHMGEDFDKSILISLKINKNFLEEFKSTCEFKNIKYQTTIKNLMIDWVLKNKI